MSIMSRQEEETEGVSGPIPLYPGDDPRPTSKREIAGWYCYGWAVEVFTVCAMGMSYHTKSTLFDLQLELMLTN